MIRLATVFSGIGAIEHALQRMGIDHKIVFACDNGDVEILTKNVGMNIDDIGQELRTLEKVIQGIQLDDEVESLYKMQLSNMLDEAVREFQHTTKQIEILSLHNDMVMMVLEKILALPSLKMAEKKKYESFLSAFEKGSLIQKKFSEMQVVLEIIKDFKKDNLCDLSDQSIEVSGAAGSEWQSVSAYVQELYEKLESLEGKKIVRRIQDLSQRTGQLHEKINYLEVQIRLKKWGDDWKARKSYVDSLYAGMEDRNRVKKSYMANYDLTEENYHWNVAFLDGKQYEGQVDLFVGGSPCQSFSLVGKQRGLEDTRGTLFYEYARLVDEIKPKVFIYENVRAVTSHDGGKTWEKMQQVFGELGYDFSWKILNARNYGIPQNRERLFVVGIKKDLKLSCPFTFPDSIPLEKKMQDFLIENAPGGYFLPAKGVDFVTNEKNLKKRYTQIDGEIQLCQKKNQQFNWHGDFVFQSEDDAKAHEISELEKYFLSEKVRKYVMASGTKGFYSKPKTDLEIARTLLTTMHKMHRAGVDNYVTTDGRLRKLTPRECLRLMGFSDTFKIVVSDTSMYQQAGNSIVVDVLIRIMGQILKSCPQLGTEMSSSVETCMDSLHDKKCGTDKGYRPSPLYGILSDKGFDYLHSKKVCSSYKPYSVTYV